jgi:outer membrane protein OmpA-like peptidoglycan-associated protein
VRYRHRYRARRNISSRRVLTVCLLLLLAALAGTLVSGFRPAHSHSESVIITATATENEPAPALSPVDLQILRSAGSSSSDATAYVVDPNTGQSTVLPLTPRRADGQVEHGPRRNQLLTDNIGAVELVLAREAGHQPFDLLTRITAATRVTPSPATLIVISSGLSTAGGFDLRQVGWEANPASIAAQLKDRGLLPSLRGYHVIFSGLGVAIGGPQSALSLPQVRKLASYWLAICRAGGAASCALDDMTRPDLPSHSSTPVPVVPVGQVTSVRGPGDTVIISLPYSLLFEFNSTALLPGANGVLRPIVLNAVRGHLQVSITGHASPDGGTQAYNYGLSSRRAVVVFRRLIALKLPGPQVTSVRGVGVAGTTLSECLVKGYVDEAICARLRDVVIVLSPGRPVIQQPS